MMDKEIQDMRWKYLWSLCVAHSKGYHGDDPSGYWKDAECLLCGSTAKLSK